VSPSGRALALCFGTFGLLNLGGTGNLWWIDVRPLPGWLLAAPAAALVLGALLPRRAGPSAKIAAALLAAVALANAARVRALGLESRAPFPVSLAVAAALLLVLLPPRARFPRLAFAATVAAFVAAFPLAQVFGYGLTSYARKADAIVVFGARCYADGKPSQSLEDRVRTGCRLWREGLAPVVVMSGGAGDGPVHETEAMRDLALRLGVPEAAIRLDPLGTNTRETVRRSPLGRILAVSHFYHLPRIQQAYRSAGRTAYTVPAEEAYRVRQTPYLVAREALAFWWYWMRG
jgi:uncharacterized SAM-binding protein YcdF (DUF218 family)